MCIDEFFEGSSTIFLGCFDEFFWGASTSFLGGFEVFLRGIDEAFFDGASTSHTTNERVCLLPPRFE